MLYTKLLVSLLISFFVLAGPVSAKSSVVLNEQIISSKQLDERSAILQAYLAKYRSPLQNNSVDFVEAADKYSLDWKLVAAISGVESTFGKRIPGGYNAWGWGVYGDQALGFKSWKDGIYTVSEGLRIHYYNKGLTNPYTINRVYAASPTWGSKVTYFLADMEKFEKQYREEQAKAELTELKLQVANNSAIVNSLALR